MNQYLFGFEVHYLCESCPGAAYDMRKYRTQYVECRECPLCDDIDTYKVAERYYRRWK